MKPQSKDLLKKWYQIAQDDIKIAVLAFDHGIYLQAAFHCQQAIEKLLKGLIIYFTSEEPPYTHDLVRLYKLLDKTKFYDQQKTIIFAGLNPFYIRTRYPSYKEEISNNLSKQKIESYINLAKEIEKWVAVELK